MKIIKLLVLLLNICLLASCSLSIPLGNQGSSDNNQNNNTNQNENNNNENNDNNDDNQEIVDRWEGETVMDTSLFVNAKKVRMSSLYTGANDTQELRFKQFAPYDDSYTFKADRNTTIELYSITGKEIAIIEPGTQKTIEFFKDEEVLTVVKAIKSNSPISYDVTLLENKSLYPYDPQEMVDAEALLEKSKKDRNIPSASTTINYKKREGGLYINCNNPEQITRQCLHTGLTRNDVSNQSVFFTFEHNNSASTESSRVDGPFYYGYQVINNGTEDAYITVKNIGFHIDGPGCWLGEKEWIDFYNTKFVVKNYRNYTAAQKNTFVDYYGFSNNYRDPDYQATTYRLPAGKYIYVMGGTTKDAYQNIDVFGTANYPVAVSGCSNGAVLFEVAGDNVEGVFYAYQDANKIQPSNKSLQGYLTYYENDPHSYGQQYVGYDNCHGVVDAHLTWEFNDRTVGGTMNNNAGNLLVNFTNYYADSITTGIPYAALNSTRHTQLKKNSWVTHINPQGNPEAVGTDMTKYITVDYNTKQPITIDYDMLDGRGATANIGNWMIDYMEHYTFVNHGDNPRNVTVGFTNNGCVAVLVRDKNGKLIEGTAQYTIVQKPNANYAAINDPFSYTVTVPANGYVQFVVEYNLLANASGYVKHYAVLE